jgi:hypothetical protein
VIEAESQAEDRDLRVSLIKEEVIVDIDLRCRFDELISRMTNRPTHVLLMSETLPIYSWYATARLQFPVFRAGNTLASQQINTRLMTEDTNLVAYSLPCSFRSWTNNARSVDIYSILSVKKTWSHLRKGADLNSGTAPQPPLHLNLTRYRLFPFSP